MSLQELKQGIEASSPEERLFLAAYLKHLFRKDDPAYQKELSRLDSQIDEGKVYTHDQVKRMHDALENEGL